jgi:transcriptional regulator of nitric oxide reductase
VGAANAAAAAHLMQLPKGVWVRERESRRKSMSVRMYVLCVHALLVEILFVKIFCSRYFPLLFGRILYLIFVLFFVIFFN